MQSSPTPDSRGNSAEVPDAETAQEHGLQEAVRILREIHTLRKRINERRADVSVEPLADMPQREENATMENELAALAESFCVQLHTSLGPIAPDGALSIAIVHSLRDIRESMEDSANIASLSTLIANQETISRRRAA